jgi:hypothetical protein
MRFGDTIRNSLRNPLAWIFFGLLLLVEYWGYHNAEKLDQVCQLSGPHNLASIAPKTDRDILDSICIEWQLNPYNDE